jgi:hypothetical protein
MRSVFVTICKAMWQLVKACLLFVFVEVKYMHCCVRALRRFLATTRETPWQTPGQIQQV